MYIINEYMIISNKILIYKGTLNIKNTQAKVKKLFKSYICKITVSVRLCGFVHTGSPMVVVLYVKLHNN